MSAKPVPSLLIIEFGSQLTLKIESGLREQGYRSAILSPAQASKWVAQHPVKGIILSGGLASVYDENAPKPPPEIFELRDAYGKPVPILGICYGMQYLAYHFRGRVEKGTPHYGRAEVAWEESPLSRDSPLHQVVWSSHGDSVMEIPPDFTVKARYADTDGIAAIASRKHCVWGVQFHPEAEQSVYGKTVLKNFADSICGCKKDWQPMNMVGEIGEGILEQVGRRDIAIIGASGGVDSSVVAAIATSVLGKHLHALTIDAGNLRENELVEIRANVAAAGVRNHVIVDESDRFFAALHGVSDAQMKRKCFKKEYSGTFQEKTGGQVKYMLQGTLAPDRIESGATGAAVIKDHHNVGLDTGALQQIHPIAHLFKYEVRALGEALGLPESIWARQPFPGPGEFIRHIGAVTRKGIDVVRWADGRTREVLERHGIYRKLSQLVVGYFDVPVVGVKGDKRVYTGFVGVRAVKTNDFMTATGWAFEPGVQKELCEILGRHPAIVHTAFFPTDKPPATTEFE